MNKRIARKVLKNKVRYPKHMVEKADTIISRKARRHDKG